MEKLFLYMQFPMLDVCIFIPVSYTHLDVYKRQGLDTSYSSKSPDTIAMIFQGITEDRKLITLEEKVYNNAKLDVPLAPSDTAVKFIAFLEQCRKNWGFARDVFIDNADQATITELNKYKRLKGCLYSFYDSYKKVTILDLSLIHI